MTSVRIGKFYVLLNGVNDVAYFGFLTLQFLLLEPTLRALLPVEYVSLSIGLAMTLITSQLLWQIFAEGPTGALADTYGRAWAVAMSFWCRTLAILIVVACVFLDLHHDSPTAMRWAVGMALILAQMLTATGEAFLEGSIEAWLRDECEVASPTDYQQTIYRAFEQSALIQNVAVLLSVTTVLAVWQFSGKAGGMSLAGVAACLCLVGAVISHYLSTQEKFTGRTTKPAALQPTPERAPLVQAIKAKLYDAFKLALRSETAAVRRLIIILILPFPCWIMLSWFFTSFVQSTASGDAGELPAAYALWLGVTLGVARVLGALVGRRLSRQSDYKGLQVFFERAVFVNVFFIFSAALLLVLRLSLEGTFSSALAIALFLPSVALAKGSEEVIKLSKNKFLASALPDAEVRATVLSFVSVAQNTFGFVTISLSGLLAFTVTDNYVRQPVIIFAACASASIAGWLIYRGRKI